MMDPLRRTRRAAAALVAALVVACAGEPGSEPAPPPSAAPTTTVVEEPTPVGGLVATIGTNRLYAVDRGFGLGLQNVSDEPVVVRQLQLDSDLFETVALTARGVVLPPRGRRLVLPVPYGEARCDGDGDAD